MSDIADDANDTAELFLQTALLKQQANSKPTPAGIGFCLYCSEEVEGEGRWCGVDCRDLWQREQGRRV